MSATVKAEVRDGILILLVDNPPVNALSQSVRSGLLEALKKSRNDDGVKAIVLACAGRSFISGADIKEFGKPQQPPSLFDTLDLLENSAKPVVAAIHVNALGGGLETALCCHFRIATKDTRLGLPEVKLGLVPGAGGTQRLPRLVGAEKAVQMVVSGDPIDGTEALKLGLVDSLFEGDPVRAGEAFARRALQENMTLRRVRDDDSKLVAARAHRQPFNDAAAAATRRNRGLIAPLANAECISYALDFPFEQGMQLERKKIEELLQGEQSKAQRHVFFAERDAAKIAGVPAETKPRKVERAVVIGAGTMGGGISMSFANAGIPVTLIEIGQEALDRGLGVIKKNYDTTVARGSLSADDAGKRMGLITGKVGLEHAKDADLVIEAVFETMDIKKDLFAKLDGIAKAGAILASNTSYLDIDQIAAVTKRPQDVLGMHFFSPANVMRLCEIVRGAKTAPDVLATAAAVSKRIGKVPAVVGNCDGFVGNRMLSARAKQAEQLLLEGALPQQVDGVLTKFGFPMGPFAMADLAGLDVGWRSRKDRGIKSEIADALCEAGRFGQKSGKGYYKYEGRAPLPDPEVEKLIEKTLGKLGRKPRSISDEEILERLVYPMINEGARILEEKIATRSGDIDIVYIYGYGWPVYRGGPMYYADTVGLKKIAERLSHYARQTGESSLEPAPLLKKLADEGKTFGSLA